MPRKSDADLLEQARERVAEIEARMKGRQANETEELQARRAIVKGKIAKAIELRDNQVAKAHEVCDVKIARADAELDDIDRRLEELAGLTFSGHLAEEV